MQVDFLLTSPPCTTRSPAYVGWRGASSVGRASRFATGKAAGSIPARLTRDDNAIVTALADDGGMICSAILSMVAPEISSGVISHAYRPTWTAATSRRDWLRHNGRQDRDRRNRRNPAKIWTDSQRRGRRSGASKQINSTATQRHCQEGRNCQVELSYGEESFRQITSFCNSFSSASAAWAQSRRHRDVRGGSGAPDRRPIERSEKGRCAAAVCILCSNDGDWQRFYHNIQQTSPYRKSGWNNKYWRGGRRYSRHDFNYSSNSKGFYASIAGQSPRLGEGIWSYYYTVFSPDGHCKPEERIMSSGIIVNIFSSQILSDVQQIVLSQETWDHILKDHGIFGLPTFQTAIENAVTISATTVHQSRTNPRSVVFVDANSTNIHGEPLRVPVKIVGNSTGFITSAYFAASKSHGDEIWRAK